MYEGDYKSKVLDRIIHLKSGTIYIDNLNVAVFDGCPRYKPNPSYCMHTQGEVLDMVKDFKDVDVIISHAGPYTKESKDIVHQGYKGLTECAFKHKVPLVVHGHDHIDKEYKLLNGTTCRCVYQVYALR